MELSDSFVVDHPIDKVWAVLTDVERIAPCLPGAQLTGSDGDEHQGLIKVKVGPITSQYTGKASFTERDDDAHRLLMSASGRDSRGAGNASAAITVQLESVTDSSTKVSVDTNLTITGKVAQFGRGVLADVSRKLMAQFAGNLANVIAQDAESAESPASDSTADDAATSAGAADDSAASGGADEGSAASAGSVDDASTSGAESSHRQDAQTTDTTASQPAVAASEEVEAVDLLEMAGASVLKRLIPAAIIVAVLIVIVILAFTM